MRIQLRSSYDSEVLVPSQSLRAFPANAKWPFGRYDHVIISSDSNKDWPRNGLHGQVTFVSSYLLLLIARRF